MITSLPRMIARAAFLVALITPTANLYAQAPSISSLRSTPSDIEREDPRIAQLISRAENHFKQGQLNLADNKREQARDEFDKAVDVILESGIDVRSHPRLREYYLQLVERVYRVEVPLQQFQQQAGSSPQLAQNTSPQSSAPAPQAPPQVGFREQKFEPSPLDELSRLELTPEEKTVTTEDVTKLEEAKNTVNFGFNTNPLIQQFINYYQGRGRATMETGLRRSGRFMQMARKIFREEGVPEDITWLGQVESAWRPTAYSWAAASGLWQFIPGTGAQYGLRQTAWIDERNSFEKATRASARYLKWLAKRYNGNWELAMAAYNTGEGNIDRAIARVGGADFWQIYPYIARETRNYVPNILATILIAKNPEKYGFYNIRPEPPLSYDILSVPTATSLQLIASATDTSVDYIRSLNPELRRDVTPRGEAYHVRIPAGKAKIAKSIINRIPPDRRDQVANIINVQPGEDLQAVAARTGTSLAQLQLWNTGVDLKAGGKVVVPTGSVRAAALVRARPNTAAPTGITLTTVRAEVGDTIARIAARYSVSADEVARLNGVAVDAQLVRGQMIRVPSQSPTGAIPTGRPARRR